MIIVLTIMALAIVCLAIIVRQERKSRRVSDRLLADFLLNKCDFSEGIDINDKLALFKLTQMHKNKWFDISKD